jgi:hypothetical protein
VRLRQAAFLALLVVAAGCGETTAKQRPTTTGPPACAPSGATTATKTSAGKPSRTMLLTDVKPDSDTCADRVVFTFEPASEQLGYRVGYLPAKQAKTEDGSGKHLAIAGKAFLVVRFEPASTADLSGAQLRVTYKGPRTFTPAGTKYVQQVTKIGDFEAILAWTIGLSEKRPFKVTSAGSPPHLTIAIG